MGDTARDDSIDQRKAKRRSRKTRGGAGLVGRVVYNDEHVDAFKWPQSVVTGNEMWRSSGEVRGAARAVIGEIARDWRIEGGLTAGGELLPERQFLEDMIDAIRGGFNDFLRCAMRDWFRAGHAIFEPVMATDEERTSVWVDQFAHVLPSAVTKFEMDDDNELRKLDILAFYGDKRENRSIDAKHLIVLTNDLEGDDLTGSPLVRPMYQHWDYAIMFWKLDAIAAEKHAMGIITVSAPDGSDEGDIEDILDRVMDYRTDEEGAIALPHGSEIGVHWPGGGGAVNPRESAQHHADRIPVALLAHFISLGLENGSRALDSSADRRFRRTLQDLGDSLFRQLMDQWVIPTMDRNFGPAVWDRTLELKCRDMHAADLTELWEAIRGLKEANFLAPTPDDEAKVRQELRMSPRLTPRETDEAGTIAPPVSPELEHEKEQAERDREHGPNRPEDKPKPGRREESLRARVSVEMNGYGVPEYGSHRELTPIEQMTDFYGMDAAVSEIAWQAIENMAGARHEFIRRIASVLANDPAASVVAPEALQMALEEAVLEAVEAGRSQVRAELDRQRQFRNELSARAEALPVLPGDDDEIEPLYRIVTDLLEALKRRAALVAKREADRLTNRAGEVIADLGTTSVVTVGIARVIERITAALDFLSPRVFERDVEDLVNRAMTDARQFEANELHAAGHTIDRVMRTAIRDRNVCEVCKSKDGKFHALNDPEFQAPDPDCEGEKWGNDCRCANLYVFAA